VSKDQQITRTRTRQQNKPLTRHTNTERATAQRRLTYTPILIARPPSSGARLVGAASMMICLPPQPPPPGPPVLGGRPRDNIFTPPPPPPPQHRSRHGPQDTHHKASTAATPRYPQGRRQTRTDAPTPLKRSMLTPFGGPRPRFGTKVLPLPTTNVYTYTDRSTTHRRSIGGSRLFLPLSTTNVYTYCGGCSFGGLGFVLVVRVCVGVRGVVLCRCVCV